MIIQCPRCSTRWRSQDAAETDNPMFKCGRCHHTFRLFPGATETEERAASTRSRAAATSASDNLEFIFPRKHFAILDPPASEVAPVVDPAPTPRDVAPPVEPQPTPMAAPVDDTPPWDTMPPRDDLAPAPISTRPTPETEERYVLGTPDGEDEERGPTTHDDRLESAEPTRPHDDLLTDLDESIADGADDLTITDEEEFDADDDDLEIDAADEHDVLDTDTATARDDEPGGRVLHLKDTMSASAPVPAFATICRSMVVLVAVFGFFAIVIRADPEQAAGWLAHVPLIGRSLSDDQALVHRIALRNLEGGYQRLHNARRVFVISGEAVNNSSSTVERIDVAGTIYDDKGQLAEKIVSTGNRTTVKLADLSEPEISYLQRFASRLTLAPGQSTRFSIVFLEPPRGVREFSSKVMSARPTSRAAAHQERDRAPDPASVG